MTLTVKESGRKGFYESYDCEDGKNCFFQRHMLGTLMCSDITRRVLFYGYGYRWLRTKDDMTVEGLWDSSSPIRRQLLGWSVNANGRFSPTDEDVPLRMWLREHSPAEAE